MWVPVAAWQPCELLYTCYLLLTLWRATAAVFSSLTYRRSSSLYSLTAISHRHSTQDTDTTVLSSCAGGVNWALTVESYTVFICQQSYLLLIGIPSPTHSFVPGLKPSFSANHSHCSRSFLLLKYLLRGLDSPDCLLLFLSISVFYF